MKNKWRTIFGFRVRVRRSLFIEDHLRNAITVAQVNKRQRPEVAPARHPTHQADSLPDIFSAQSAA